MHDFCLTLPYGFILAVGGFIGAVKSGSWVSGMVGGGSGAALMLVGKFSLDEYHRNKDLSDEEKKFSSVYAIVSLVITLLVTYLMADRYLETGKIMPAGAVGAMSALMSIFYLLKVYERLTLSTQPKAKVSHTE